MLLQSALAALRRHLASCAEVHIMAQIVLSRWAQQDDVVVGTATNGRNRPELQGMVGDLVNMVALRTKMQPAQTFLQVGLLWHVRLSPRSP